MMQDAARATFDSLPVSDDPVPYPSVMRLKKKDKNGKMCNKGKKF
jgi:hypothetical protein